MAYTNMNGRGLGDAHAVMVSRQQGADCRLVGTRPTKAPRTPCRRCGKHSFENGERSIALTIEPRRVVVRCLRETCRYEHTLGEPTKVITVEGETVPDSGRAA